MKVLSRLAVDHEQERRLFTRQGEGRGIGLDAAAGGMTGTVLHLQRMAGNRAVNTLLRQHTPADLASLAVVQRAVVQREDPPDPPDPFKDPTQRPDPITGPGGPGDTNDKGFTCGIKNGKFTCGVDIGKGDPLDLPGDWSKFGPSKPDAGGIQGPGNCPPGMFNKMTMSCCKPGTHADDSGWNCVQDAGPTQDQLPALPPAPPSQPGDFPVPDPNADTQVA